MSITRRVLLLTVAATGATLVVVARAQAKLDEKDPQAVAAMVADSRRRNIRLP